MMSLYSTILIVDDDVNTLKGLAEYLESKDFDVLRASTGEAALEIFRKEKPDLVLSDIKMPGMSGIELLEKIKAEKHSAEVILLTAYGSVEDAVKAMKKGAYYYLTKPVNLEELDFLINKAINSRKLKEENRELMDELYREKIKHGKLLVQSKVMKSVLDDVDKIAQSNATVLIEGESGTGKELIAHRLHDESHRKNKPFIAVHCASLTDTLLLSELFGHEKGSFTGASDRKIGRFEKAHQGTLFLDEIGDISMDTQVKLLRILQEREFERVGGTKTIKVDVRLICATNKNLMQEVKDGRFREDLYYRLNVIYLKVPPLRDRMDDLDILIPAFIEDFAKQNGKGVQGMKPEAIEVMKKYNWPGNVRELRNIIERMIVLNQKALLDIEDIPQDIKKFSNLEIENSSLIKVAGAVSFAQAASSNHQLEDVEKEFIQRKLIEAKGNKSSAAKLLGISRRTLYRKIEEYNL